MTWTYKYTVEVHIEIYVVGQKYVFVRKYKFANIREKKV